jgi:ABC-type lipoprotein release transport system permease subunit
MDPTWLLVVLMLIVLFASISIVGALRRIRVATEKTLAILETQTTGEVNRLAR